MEDDQDIRSHKNLNSQKYYILFTILLFVEILSSKYNQVHLEAYLE